jgi:hypothetical protein
VLALATIAAAVAAGRGGGSAPAAAQVPRLADSVLTGVEQDLAQVAAKHLRAPARAVVGFVEQYRAVLVEHVRGLAALVDDRVELALEVTEAVILSSNRAWSSVTP